MKRIVVFLLLLTFCLSIVACGEPHSDPCDLSAGKYYMVCDENEFLIPYLYLNFSNYTFDLGAADVISYAQHGKFVVKGSKLTATTESGIIYVFEIVGQDKLILVKNGDPSWIPAPDNAEFVFKP